MMRIAILSIIFFLIVSGGSAQEYLVPLVNDHLKRLDMVDRAERIRLDPNKNHRGGSMELPFIDDFSTDKFAGNEDNEPVHWVDHQAFRNNTYGISPPSIGIVTFDGADEYGYPYDFNASNAGVPCDTLTSVPINLDYDESENIWFSFFYQGGGLGEQPDGNQGDSLTLHFYSPNLDQWFHAWSVAATAMVEFEQIFVPITQSRYLRDGFRFRFINYATPRGAMDHTHIDYVQLDRNRVENEVIDDVAYIYPVRTLLASYSSMPWTHFSQSPAQYMAESVDLTAFNNNTGNRTIFDRTTEIYYDGILQGQHVNTNSPPIFAQSELVLTEPINSGDFNFVYDITVNDTFAIFDVEFSNVVTPDFIVTNNTVRMHQEFYSYYAYDDGSPERGYSLNVTGSRTAMRYVNMKADSLIGLMIWFNSSNKYPANGANSFFPYVWADSGSGNGPGEQLAQGLWSNIEILPDTTYGFRLYHFLEPVFIPEGPFYVGTLQTTPDHLGIGIDFNSDHNQGNLFYYIPQSGVWEASSFGGSLMVRPVFKSPNIGPLDVPEELLQSARIFPNPVVDQLFIHTGEAHFRGTAEVLDLTGKIIHRADIQEESQLSLSAMQSGMYLLRISSNDGSAQRVFKFVKH